MTHQNISILRYLTPFLIKTVSVLLPCDGKLEINCECNFNYQYYLMNIHIFDMVRTGGLQGDKQLTICIGDEYSYDGSHYTDQILNINYLNTHTQIYTYVCVCVYIPHSIIIFHLPHLSYMLI